MFKKLQRIIERPEPFSVDTVERLWNDPHISKQMLAYHLNPDSEPASRNHAFVARSIEWIAERFSLGPAKAVADFGCGPGLYTLPLAEKGARVTGIDFSERSIAYAQEQALQKGLSIEYRCQNYLEFASKKYFDLITLIYCDFCPLSPDKRQRLLEIFAEHLKPEGHLLLDVCSESAFRQRQEGVHFGHRFMDGFWSEADYFGFQNTLIYPEEKIVLDKYTVVESWDIREIYNWLQFFSLESLKAELEAGGFKVVDAYADVAGAPYRPEAPEISVVAKKVP